MYALTLAEVVKWTEVADMCNQEGRYQKKARLLVTTLLKLIRHREVPLVRLQDFDEVSWFQVESVMPADMKEAVKQFMQASSPDYPSLPDLER